MAQNILITDFGAKEGILSTDAIQKAFDAASKAGGATVVIPKGTFISGTLNMGSASLYLEKGAVLKASSEEKDYYHNGYSHNEMIKTISFLFSLTPDNITISGEGRIDLSGDDFYDFNDRQTPPSHFPLSKEQFEECTPTIHFRPTQPIFFLGGSHITVKDITITDAPCWTMSFNNCEDIRVENLTIKNNPCLPNNDGMHFCSCRNVIIRGCNIVSGDDCIALSAITDWNIPCENIVISDCILSSCSKTIVIGYMHSIIRNVCISNCVIRDSQRGICLMTSSDTSLIEDVVIDNVLIDTRVRTGNWWGNGEPICIFALYHHLDNYRDPAPDRKWPVNIRNIHMQNISCKGENIIGIIGKNDNIQNVTIDGLFYERKPAKNTYFKGINTVDISPSNEKLPVLDDNPYYWLLVQGCKDIAIRNANVLPFEEHKLKAVVVDCNHVTIPE
jgi:polygalacturonase